MNPILIPILLLIVYAVWGGWKAYIVYNTPAAWEFIDYCMYASGCIIFLVFIISQWL